MPGGKSPAHLCSNGFIEAIWLKGATSRGFVLKLQSKMIVFGFCALQVDWGRLVETKSQLVPSSVQSLSHVRLCDPMNCSMPGLPVHHQLPELTQTYVHWVSDAIQPSHPLLSPSPPAFNLSKHQVLFKWVSFSHQVAKLMEFQLQHQSFQWTPRTDLL